MSKIPTQYLLKGNLIVNIENVTGGKEWTDEGLIDITSEITFTVIYKNLRFGVEVHHVEEDADMYAIAIYDQTSEPNRYRRESYFDNPNNYNEICYCYLDSTGGTFYEDEISTGYEEVDDAIMAILFGNETIEPYIKPF